MFNYKEGAYCFKQGHNSYTVHYYLSSTFETKNLHLHREDGPAVEHHNPNRKDAWWLNGHRIPVDNQKDFERYVKLMIFI